jgi:sodium-dependent dicarboxylate transporter 2/3/5
MRSPSPLLKARLGDRSSLVLALTCLAFALLLALPLPAGLSEAGHRSIVLVLAAIALWVTEAIPPPLTAFLILALHPILGVLGFEASLAGFANSSVWLLFGVFVISICMQESGLDRRIALSLLSLAKGNARATVLMVVLTTLLFVFLLPTSAGRAALMTPICVGVARAMSGETRGNIGKTLLLSFSYVSLVSSMGVMTGAMATILAVSLFRSVLGFDWTYLMWFKLMFPPALVSALLIWVAMVVILPPEIRSLPGGQRFIREELRDLGRLKGREIRVMVYMAVLITLWLGEKTFGISIAHSCILMAGIAMLPGIGLVEWNTVLRKMSWDILVLLGSSLCMAQGLMDSHAIEWLAGNVFGGVAKAGPLALGLAVMLATVVFRLGFPNNFSVVAAMLPLVFTLAATSALNPVWLGLLCVGASVLGLLFPTQAMTHLTVSSAGYFSLGDMVRMGLLLTIVIIGVVLAAAFFYWPLFGVGPV